MERIDYLPLGSVVYLNEGNKKVLIIARGLIAKNGDGHIFFDYGGVPYPEGLVDDQMAYFQHDSISKVVFKGFSDMDDEATVDKINAFAESHQDIPRGNVKQLLGNE
ncbi:MAG: DUF4176 domain-containing protein [Eubacterium sp.]